MSSDWKIDAEARTITAKAWGGTLTAFKRPLDHKWAMEWKSDDKALEIAAHVHWLPRFGLDEAPEARFRDETDEHGELFGKAASYNGARSILLHLRQHYWTRLAVFRADPGPSVFIGPDPF